MTSEEIQAIFFVECEESHAAAEAGLAACKAGTQDSDTINAIFRAVHSIKGGAGAFGFTALQGFTHVFETLLSDVRENLVPLTPALIDMLLSADMQDKLQPETFAFPSNAAAKPPLGIAGDTKVHNLDWGFVAKERGEWVKRWDREMAI